MRQTKSLNQDGPRFNGNRNAQIKLTLTLVLIAASSAVAFVSRAYNQPPRSLAKLSPGAVAAKSSATQGVQQQRRLPSGRLALQPEADRLRRRLGQRFLEQGQEVTSVTGTLTIGTERQTLRITRTQGEDGERIEIALGGRPAVLAWDSARGATSEGKTASGSDQSLIERIALDSADQFIMAQLRGASYYTVARAVQPASAAGPDAYEGPVWDVVRVTEPQDERLKQPLSRSRHYFINSWTGQLERIVSDEQGETIIAELSGWATQAGESAATRIVWTRNKQPVMELNVTSFASGPGQ